MLLRCIMLRSILRVPHVAASALVRGSLSNSENIVMKNRLASLVVSVSIALALVACNRATPPADNLPATAVDSEGPAAPASVAAPAPAVVSDVNFTVDPASVYNCEGRDRTTSMIRWNVTRPGVKQVKVLVIGPGDTQKKTLALMNPVGEAATGNWVAKGVRIELVDAETGAELASHVVDALPCE